LMSGGRDSSDWVRNIQASPDVELEIGGERRSTTAKVVEASSDEDGLARRLLVEKYTFRGSDDLEDWGRDSLPIAIDWPRG
jgi:F420H(2)-dependent quinone reductase